MTNEELNTDNSRYQIPLGSGLRKVERKEGEKFNVAGARFTWKVKGEDTGYAFSIYEQELEPGEGVPLHCHAYGEVFYVLSGHIDFLQVTGAGEDWITCGNAADFDGWADDGAPGWSYRELLPYFIRSECNERGDPRYHGHCGPLAVQDSRSMHPLVDHLIEAGVRSGYRSNDDFNAASQMGVGRFQLTQRNGVRCSTASAYLDPARERKNLHVFTDSLVLRLQVQGLRATGVSIYREGREETLFSEREIVLAPAPMARPKSSCYQVSGRRMNWLPSVFLQSSIFRSERTCRTIRCCQ